jgi:hypothetical protein
MMTQTLISSVPGIYTALLGLVTEAAEEEANPQVTVFPFELDQYEPAAYIVLSEIRGPRYEWESFEPFFAQKEFYSIHGKVIVFTGDSGTIRPEVVTNALVSTFDIFQQCVMSPIMSNRNEPMLGTTGPSPYLMLPEETSYEAGVGKIAGTPGGWDSILDWAFRFEALLTVEPPGEP